MYFETGLGSFRHLQQALLVAFLSLLIIFVVELYNTRARYVKLNQDLMSI